MDKQAVTKINVELSGEANRRQTATGTNTRSQFKEGLSKELTCLMMP
jgi:hypothetical protein